MMSSRCAIRSPMSNLIFSIVLLATVILVIEGGNNFVQADDFPTFFLKAAKSVPRIGRRSGASPKDIYNIHSEAGRRGFLTDSADTAAWPLGRNTGHASGSTGLSSAEENYIQGLEQSPEFWGTPASEMMYPGFGNEVWRREKRSGTKKVNA